MIKALRDEFEKNFVISQLGNPLSGSTLVRLACSQEYIDWIDQHFIDNEEFDKREMMIRAQERASAEQAMTLYKSKVKEAIGEGKKMTQTTHRKYFYPPSTEHGHYDGTSDGYTEGRSTPYKLCDCSIGKDHDNEFSTQPTLPKTTEERLENTLLWKEGGSFFECSDYEGICANMKKFISQELALQRASLCEQFREMKWVPDNNKTLHEQNMEGYSERNKVLDEVISALESEKEG